MAIETLANFYVRDDSIWKFPGGDDRGVSVLDGGTWKIVKEIYVRDGGSWKYTHPIQSLLPILLGSDGVCDGANATNSMRLRILGPTPQVTAETGHYYFFKWYWRNSTISSAHCQSLNWTQIGTTAGISVGIIITPTTSQNYVRERFGTTNRWTQMHSRLFHSVYGEMTLAQGGHGTTIVKGSATKDCGGPE